MILLKIILGIALYIGAMLSITIAVASGVRAAFKELAHGKAQSDNED